MRRIITIVLTVAFIVGIVFLHNKRISERDCIRKRNVPGMELSRCTSGLAAVRSAMILYAAEWNVWSSDVKRLGLMELSDEHYGFSILLAKEGRYVASCSGNIDEDERLDIWVVTDRDTSIVNLSDDCYDKGKIDGMGRWKEEVAKIYEESTGKSL